jgi:hypothetical protein
MIIGAIALFKLMKEQLPYAECAIFLNTVYYEMVLDLKLIEHLQDTENFLHQLEKRVFVDEAHRKQPYPYRAYVKRLEKFIATFDDFLPSVESFKPVEFQEQNVRLVKESAKKLKKIQAYICSTKPYIAECKEYEAKAAARSARELAGELPEDEDESEQIEPREEKYSTLDYILKTLHVFNLLHDLTNKVRSVGIW